MSAQHIIIETARQAHRKAWTATSGVSAQTKSSIEACRIWQSVACDIVGKALLSEYPVAEGYGEKIDLVDTKDAVAYELKVSKNNTHFEFYRDIFKVVVHNERGKKWKIKKLVFITPAEGARKLRSAYVDAVVRIAMEKHNLEIEISPI